MVKLDLATRFVIFIAITLVAVLGAMNVWFYSSHAEHLNKTLENRVIGILEVLETSVGYYIRNYEDELILELGSEIIAKDNIVFLSIKDIQGNEYFEVGNPEVEVSHNYRRTITFDGKEVGLLSLSVDTSELQEELKSALRYSIGLMILSVTMIGGMIFLFFKKTIMVEMNQSQHDKQILHDLAKTLESEVNNRTQELLLAKEVAEKANQAKTKFLSRMSHELRTPMNAILGFGQLLECDEELSAEQKPQVKEILNAGHHLLDLINDVLDISRIETGSIKVKNEPVDCCQLLDEALRLIAPLAEKRNISLQHEKLRNVDEFLYADPTRLKQILLNLLSNAVKYNREGGVITVSAEQLASKRVRISVVDTGEGLAKDQLHHLFQPFERLGAEFSNIEGNGIGLVICKSIVEMMGGKIGVESEPGKGSTFWVELDTMASMKDTPDAQGAGNEGSQKVHTAG